MALMDLQSDLSRKDNPQERQKIIGRPSVTAIARDTERVTKFLLSGKGLIFTAKQFAQQLMNPNTENIEGKAGVGLTKIYDPISPITNTIGAPLGLRTDRLMPPLVRSPLSTYEGIHKARKASPKHSEIDNNRLIRLKSELLAAPEDDTGPRKLLKKIQDISNKLQGFEGQVINTLSGLTGPKSVGGIGATTIRRYADTSMKKQSEFVSTHPKGYGVLPSRLQNSGTGAEYSIVNTYEADPFVSANNPEDQLEAADIKPKDVIGNQPVTPGHSKLDQTDHIVMPYNNIPTRESKKELLDFRVLRELPEGETDAARYSEEGNRLSNFGNTLALLDTIDATVDESLIDFSFDDIAFKAYLGTISDNFAPTWNSAEDQGRADPRYQYGGFERTLSFDFIVVAYNKDQLIEIWNKLQNLARLTYPVYGSEGFFGQTTNVTIGKLFDERPMLIQDLGYDWDNETPWEIDEDYQSPFYTTVTMTCIVLGNRPQSTSQVYNITGLA